MSADRTGDRPATDPDALVTKGKQGRFWQVFWLTFLGVSLAAAWYCFYAPSNRIAWIDDVTVAQQRAAEAHKPVILFFTGAWCSPCQIMKRQVWADDEVMRVVNGAFIPVMIDVDDQNAAATVSRYRVGATPLTILADAEGEVLDWRQGAMGKGEFLEFLGNQVPSAVEGL